MAEGTRTWIQTSYDDFEKGTANGVAISSEGALQLAPSFRAVATTPSTYLWAVAAGPSPSKPKTGLPGTPPSPSKPETGLPGTPPRDSVFVGAGAPARVYVVQDDGKISTIFEPPELQVQALVVDSKGILYAATSPDGKVYKIQPDSSEIHNDAGGEKSAAGSEPHRGWSSSVFYEPKTKYIWALAIDVEGRLYIATGDHGEIFRVDRDGHGSLFFKSDEAHIRALAFDPQGNLIAGSDGSGLIYRISPRGEAFVLYSAAKKEITALAVDPAGNIYAAGAGDKRPPSGVVLLPSGGGVPVAVANPGGTPAVPSALSPLPGAVPGSPPLLPGQGAVGSEVYRIAPDGSPTRLWESREDLVYALGFDGQGRLVAGTGNKGRILLIQGEQEFTDLLRASATQVTGFASAPGGGLYVATSNLGKVFRLGEAPDNIGTYDSDVFDAKTFSRWGRAEVRARGACELWARSGNVENPDRNWSPWAQTDWRKDEALPVPAARFIQWRAVLRPGPSPAEIESVGLNYLPKNVAPVVDEVAVRVGARFQSLPKSSGPENVTVGFGPQPGSGSRSEITPSAVRDRDAIAVRWAAHDDNDDQLLYSLYYRGEGETRWKLLKDKLTDKFYSFDAGLLPDGGYTIKVVASDTPSNSPDTALSGERESPYFEVDTTPPRIDSLRAEAGNGKLRIRFRATDDFSAIKRAEYSVDAGDWQNIEPVGRISDARTENYDFTAPTTLAAPSSASKPGGASDKAAGTAPADEHLVVVRVWDKFDNTATAKTIVHGAR